MDQGYEILTRNFRFHKNEIDIIAKDGKYLVFVEVKARRNRVFGEPEDAVDYMKMHNLRAAINHYVKFKNIRLDIRFDIITVVGTPYMGQAEITHIEDVPFL
jgi:putative endonuclease